MAESGRQTSIVWAIAIVLVIACVAVWVTAPAREALAPLATDSTLIPPLPAVPPESLAAQRARADSMARMRARANARKRAAARRSEVLAQARALCPGEYMPRHISGIIRAHPDWSDEALATVGCGRIAIGLTAEQVRISWHDPERINRTVSQYGTREQWVYGDAYVYFENGVLESWQDSR